LVAGDHHHRAVGVEPIHLHQQLVERLLALLVGADLRPAPPATEGVDLVEEDDAGRVLLGVTEEVADPGRAHATNISTKSLPLSEK